MLQIRACATCPKRLGNGMDIAIMSIPAKPLIGIICNLRIDGPFRMHSASEKYANVVHDLCHGAPILIPAMGDGHDVDSLLDHLDGVILTGGASNVEPARYGAPSGRPDGLHDAYRDGTAMLLVRNAIARGVPLFGICRGIQEMNVALGGSLHQFLHEVAGREDHRMERFLPMQDRFRLRNRLQLAEGGLLSKLLDGAQDVEVNSLHAQGIDHLAPGLKVEAVAADGTIEAVTFVNGPGFAVGVQWHAEHKPAEHPLYKALFEAFGEAARAHMINRRGGALAAE